MSVAENNIENYLNEGYESIHGWLLRPALDVTSGIRQVQRSRFEPRAICEIGVWQGRYLTLLSFFPEVDKPIVGIDPIIHVPDREFQIRLLNNNIKKYARFPNSVNIIYDFSCNLTAECLLEIGRGEYNFISVDGDHTANVCYGDLLLCEKILHRSGIVAVDDFPNPGCPGVIDAVYRYAGEHETGLSPVALAGNKLFLAFPEYVEFYQSELNKMSSRGDLGDTGKKILNYKFEMDQLNICLKILGRPVIICP